MTRIVLLALSLIALVLGAGGAWAQLAVDAYRVEATVANQSEAERIAATKANMGEVITRVLGDSTAVQHPLVRQAINEAPNYLAKFSYTSEKNIVLNYSPQAIQSLLQQAQLIAVNANTAQGTTLYVVDVKDFSTFKQVQAYLKTVGVLRNINLVNIEKDVMQFSVVLDGNEQLLKTTLATGNKLQVVGENPLSFRWQNQ